MTSRYLRPEHCLVTPVVVNSRFLQQTQKRSRENQLIHRRLAKIKSIGSGSDPESQADSQGRPSHGGNEAEIFIRAILGGRKFF